MNLNKICDMSEPIFKIENISKSFSKNMVLKNIDLEIMPGEIIGIIGASGSGKTTFLNLIIGFIRPDKGDVKFRLSHLLSYKQNAIYRSVYDKQALVKTVYGFASQVPSYYDELTIKENLDYFGTLHNLSTDAIKVNTETLLSLMNLQYATNIQAKNLSGGMKRRLDIACSLMHDPEVLILDEPTADLDTIHRNQIWSLIKKINAKGTTIILSSHHLNELENICTRVAILDDKEIVALDSPTNLKNKITVKEQIYFKVGNKKQEKIIKQLKSGNKDKIKLVNGEIEVETTDVDKSLMKILETIKKHNEKLKSIRVVGASLDDVFINLIEK